MPDPNSANTRSEGTARGFYRSGCLFGFGSNHCFWISMSVGCASQDNDPISGTTRVEHGTVAEMTQTGTTRSIGRDRHAGYGPWIVP